MRDTNALSNLAQQWEDWPGKSALSPNHKNQQQSMEYGLIQLAPYIHHF